MKQLPHILFLMVLGLQLTGQKMLSGNIRDAETNDPLIGASVTLVNNPEKGTVSDVQGLFTIYIPDSELSVELLVQYLGYEEQLLVVKADNYLPIEISLSPAAIPIEKIVVAATPTLGEEFVVQEITKLEIYTNPNSRADPIRAVNSLPSGTSVDESANLSLRGSPPGETGFVLNRVPIDDVFKLDQSNGVGQFSIFNTSIISKIDVYPSNPPLEYGGSSSGLIALYTDDIGEHKSRSFNLTMAGLGLKTEDRINAKNGLITYANYNLNNGLKAFNKKAFEDLRSFNSFDCGLYWVSTIDSRTKLKVFNYFLKENYEYNFELPSHAGSSLQRKKRNQTVIDLERKLGSKTNLNLNQGINFSAAQYDYGNTSHNARKQDYFSSLNLSRFDKFFTFGAGLSLRANVIDNEGRYPRYFWAVGPQHPVTPYTTEESFLMPEFYSYQKLRFSENLILGLGNRRTITTSDNVGEYSSNQINLSYSLNPSHNVKLSLGKYHKLFVPGEQFYAATLVASRHYSLDYSWTKNRIKLSAAAYAKKTSYDNSGLNILGAELFCAYDYRAIKTSLSVAHVHAEIETEENLYPSKNDLSYFVRHLFKYKLGTHWEFNSVLFLRSGSFYTPVSGSSYHESTQTFEPIYSSYDEMQRLPNYSLWDLSISKISQVKDGVLIVFVSSSNVLDRKNVSGIKYNAAYENVGNRLFGRRVLFMGAVYNW